MNAITRIKQFLSPQSASHLSEKAVATLGGCLSIYLITWISVTATDFSGAAAIVPSMGAATVLLFAVPHGPMSQPWALFGGNVLSALVGVSCARWIPSPFLAASLAVGLAIAVMHIFRCIHPPGGATALAAVIGGQSIHDLGFNYVLTPTLLNCTVIFSVALIFNNIFPWRRYPMSLMRYQASHLPVSQEAPVGLPEVRQALEQSEVLIDVAPEQLFDLYQRAQHLSRSARLSEIPIEVGAYYTNDKAGSEWSVRQVLEESRHANPALDQVIYRVVDGKERHRCDCSTRQQFALWAKRRVKPAVAKE